MAPQRDREDVIEKRLSYLENQPRLDPSRLVFLDETSVSLWMARNYGYADRGKPAVIKRPHRSKNLSVVGAMGLDGIRASMCIPGPIDGDAFCAWLRVDLCPALKPGDLVVMDNLSTHKMAAVETILATVGARPLFLPPYSPDLNPIEMLWAKAKARLRAATATTEELVMEVLGKIFRELPLQTCFNWIRHCGYAVEGGSR